MRINLGTGAGSARKRWILLLLGSFLGLVLAAFATGVMDALG
ncbi:hypothetical protein ABZO31_17955 [Streptomyces sp. HUAS MG47]